MCTASVWHIAMTSSMLSNKKLRCYAGGLVDDCRFGRDSAAAGAAEELARAAPNS